MTIAGVSTYRKIQRWIFVPAIIITFVTFVVVLLVTSHSSWQEHFNALPANKEAGVTVDKVFSTASAAGWKHTGMNLGDTLIWIPIMMGAIPFAVFAAEGMLGEVKGARNFRKMALTFVLGAFIIGTVVLAFIYFLFERTVSRDFISAASYATNTGKLTLPTGLDLSNMTSLVSGSSLLAIAIGIGFIASAFQLMVGIYMDVTRMLVSMGLDRSLPSTIAKVSERTRTPVFAATLYLVLTAVTSAFFISNSDWYTPLISTASRSSGEGILLFGCLAAGCCRSATPGSTRPRPWPSTACSACRCCSSPARSGSSSRAWLPGDHHDQRQARRDRCGVRTEVRSAVVVLAPLVLAVIIYFGWRAVEARRGVDASLAFKEIPPE